MFIGSFGVSADKEVEGAFLDDLKKAGLLSIPVTLIILIVVFGALVAAGIPLLLALTAIIATFGLVALPTSLIPIDEVTYELILLIGLAVGVDYSMFYLKREREERAAGRSEEAALEAAAATSGRSVLISGLTVIIAMSGMFLAGVQGMSAFATGHDPGRRGGHARDRSRFSRPRSPGSATASNEAECLSSAGCDAMTARVGSGERSSERSCGGP